MHISDEDFEQLIKSRVDRIHRQIQQSRPDPRMDLLWKSMFFAPATKRVALIQFKALTASGMEQRMAREITLRCFRNRLQKSCVPTIDTRESDARWKERLRKERESTEAPSKRGGFMSKLSHKGDKAPMHGDKPISHNSFKIKYPNGRTFQYTTNENGSITRRETNDYVPTFSYEQLHNMHEHAQKEHEKHQQEAAEKTTSEKEKEKMEQSTIKKSFFGNQMKKTDTTQMTGHQLAYQRLGGDPTTISASELSRMDRQAMEADIHRKRVESTIPLRRKYNLPDPPADTTKCVYPSYC
jgi:hypothetical protein